MDGSGLQVNLGIFVTFVQLRGAKNVVTEDHKAWMSAQAGQKPQGKDKKDSYSKKEGRKREMGQASRGKAFHEDEKRILRQYEAGGI